jgi:hypothetical protein
MDSENTSVLIPEERIMDKIYLIRSQKLCLTGIWLTYMELKQKD